MSLMPILIGLSLIALAILLAETSQFILRMESKSLLKGLLSLVLAVSAVICIAYGVYLVLWTAVGFSINIIGPWGTIILTAVAILLAILIEWLYRIIKKLLKNRKP